MPRVVAPLSRQADRLGGQRGRFSNIDENSLQVGELSNSQRRIVDQSELNGEEEKTGRNQFESVDDRAARLSTFQYISRSHN